MNKRHQKNKNSSNFENLGCGSLLKSKIRSKIRIIRMFPKFEISEVIDSWKEIYE